jgi:hypothetical protein
MGVGKLGLRAVLPRVAAGSILPIWAAPIGRRAPCCSGRPFPRRADSVAEAGSDLPSAQLDGPAQFRWGRRRCRAVPARSVTPLQLRRRKAKGVTIEGRQTGGPPRRQARPSGPSAGGVHAGCSGAPVTIRGEIRWTRSASAHDEGHPGGQGQRCGVGLSGARRDGSAAREARPRVGKRPGEGVPSMVELTLRAGLQPWSPKATDARSR